MLNKIYDKNDPSMFQSLGVPKSRRYRQSPPGWSVDSDSPEFRHNHVRSFFDVVWPTFVLTSPKNTGSDKIPMVLNKNITPELTMTKLFNGCSKEIFFSKSMEGVKCRQCFQECGLAQCPSQYRLISPDSFISKIFEAIAHKTVLLTISTGTNY